MSRLLQGYNIPARERMARVLCIGVEKQLIETRKRILEASGHTVVTATNQVELVRACKEHAVEVAVIGQAIPRKEKRRVLSLVREHCPMAKVLELYPPSTGKVLNDADDWIEVTSDVPPQLAERVSALAVQRRSRGHGAKG